jgi:hypothetical protein
MAFVKLDTRILESTLWIERDCREVFITALLMAMPREFLEPQPQIAVRQLEETGFVVPPGWYGFVDAAGIGIVRRAMVDPDAGLDSLERLGSADLESRTADFDGRRLVRVNGGYIVLNFMKYRDKDNTAAERAKRYRERQRTLENASEHRDGHNVTRDASLEEVRGQSTETTSKQGQKKQQARGSRLPQGWVLSQGMMDWARDERPDVSVATEFASFCDYWHGVPGAKGVKLDWDATFRNWIRRATGPVRRTSADSAPSKARQKLNNLQEFRNGLAQRRNSAGVSTPDLPLLGSSTDRRPDSRDDESLV